MTVPKFDLYGTLPRGQVAIEASAGTGKTFTLAGLATRFLAERDVAPSELLIVTFTRAATAELRSRIRGQLVTSGSALADGVVIADEDELSSFLARSDRNARRQRLERAVSDFDAAAISTIHSFAAQVRGTLGISTAIDPDVRLTTDVAKLVRHACADALAAASTGGISVDDLPKLSALVRATAKYVEGPDLDLEPKPGRPGATTEQVQLHQLVLAAEANLAALLRDSGTMGFDDVLSQLRRALAHESSNAVIDALRHRFKVVLIDEFQDTDRVQWEIFSTLFGTESPSSTLVLVGDPKQAIYRFRGADIAVYLDAVGATPADSRFTLGTNWRSDSSAVDAMHAVLDGVSFGSEDIAYAPVDASSLHADERMTGADGEFSGLEVRLAVGAWVPKSGKTPIAGRTGRLIERDLVTYVRHLLDTASIPDKEHPGVQRRLRPSDIGVLVTAGAHARSAQTALRRQGVPAVIAGSGSVFSSWAAEQLRLLLAAMERPSDLGRVRAFALSWFVPWTPLQVAGATDDELAVLQEQLAAWSAALATHPVAEVLTSIWSETGVVATVLGEFDGDRNVTDLDHLMELMHNSAPQGMSGVAGLLSVLDRPPETEEDIEFAGDVVARRIESQEDAVQIMTVWKAKGLQFPVVCLPMLWRLEVSLDEFIYTDPHTRQRTMDLAKGARWPDAAAAKARGALARDEATWEQFRVLYVALTRGQHHTAVWWANSKAGGKKALSRLLFSRDEESGELDREVLLSGECNVPSDGQAVDALAGLVERSGQTISVSSIPEPVIPSTMWAADEGETPKPHLEVSQFAVALDRGVHRWSFSSMTSAPSGSTDPYDLTDGDRGAEDEDESVAGDEPVGGSERPTGQVGALMELRAGTEFGTFVHGVLERVDFASVDLDAELEVALVDQQARSGFDLAALAPEGVDGSGLLIAGLHRTIETPLGPLFNGTRLADISRRDRIDELGFDLRVGEADRRPTVRDIGVLVARYLPPGHPLGAWADALAAGAIDVRLAGYLTGSIDLVARTTSVDGTPGFVVADYKTNQLTPWGHAPAPDDYDHHRMADAMAEHHYPLQALLYAAALLRYLRSRRHAGAPEPRVLGATYLFVRGMTGAAVPADGDQPYGVFTWAFDPGMVAALSDLLDGQVVV